MYLNALCLADSEVVSSFFLLPAMQQQAHTCSLCAVLGLLGKIHGMALLGQRVHTIKKLNNFNRQESEIKRVPVNSQ